MLGGAVVDGGRMVKRVNQIVGFQGRQHELRHSPIELSWLSIVLHSWM